MPLYLHDSVYRSSPFQTIDEKGVGELLKACLRRVRVSTQVTPPVPVLVPVSDPVPVPVPVLSLHRPPHHLITTSSLILISLSPH